MFIQKQTKKYAYTVKSYTGNVTCTHTHTDCCSSRCNRQTDSTQTTHTYPLHTAPCVWPTYICLINSVFYSRNSLCNYLYRLYCSDSIYYIFVCVFVFIYVDFFHDYLHSWTSKHNFLQQIHVRERYIEVWFCTFTFNLCLDTHTHRHITLFCASANKSRFPDWATTTMRC